MQELELTLVTKAQTLTGSLAENEKSLSDSEKLAQSTNTTLIELRKTCALAKQAADDLDAKLAQDVDALKKATEMIQTDIMKRTAAPAGDGSASATAAGALIKKAATVHQARVTRSVDDPLLVYDRVSDFLESSGDNLNEDNLRQLGKSIVGLVAASASASTSTSTSQTQSPDPLAKVKNMIADLVTRLQEEAAKEAEHDQWCKTELSKAKTALESAEKKTKMTANLIAKTSADLAKFQEEAGDLGKELESTRNEILARDTKR
jgi:hypothetical protein